MTYDDQNIFAKILRGEMPCTKVYEDAHSLAFLDIMPQVAGHCLVLPKSPAVNILDVDDESLGQVMATVRKLAPVIVEVMGADGFRLMQFNGAAAGQTVFHLHVHILPMGDATRIERHGAGSNMADMAVLADQAARIVAVLGD